MRVGGRGGCRAFQESGGEVGGAGLGARQDVGKGEKGALGKLHPLGINSCASGAEVAEKGREGRKGWGGGGKRPGAQEEALGSGARGSSQTGTLKRPLLMEVWGLGQ